MIFGFIKNLFKIRCSVDGCNEIFETEIEYIQHLRNDHPHWFYENCEGCIFDE